MVEHDWKNFPELTNAQMGELEFLSPHVQIKNDFRCVVVRVVDGDTIRVKCDFRDFDFPVRLGSIDAPEMNAGGEIAKAWLKDMIEGQEVEIKIDSNNRVGKYGRLLGDVYSMGMSMSEAMMSLGLALPFSQRNEGKLPDLNKIFRLEQWF